MVAAMKGVATRKVTTGTATNSLNFNKTYWRQ